MTKIADQIRDLVADGKLEEAVDALEQLADSSKSFSLRDELILVSSQLRDLKAERRKNLYSAAEIAQRQNRLVHQILEIISSLDSGEKQERKSAAYTSGQTAHPAAPRPSRNWLKIAGSSIMILALLVIGALFLPDLFRSGNPVAPTGTGPAEESADIGSATPVSSGIQAAGKPDMYITSLRFDPATPTQGERVNVEAVVKNKGADRSGAFTLQWWPGENYPEPAYQKTINGLNAGTQKTIRFTYDGYPSPYGRITSKLVLDAQNRIAESDENNNVYKKTISVNRTSGGSSASGTSKAELTVTGFQMRPATPTQGESLRIQAIVKNTGQRSAPKFKVEWWAGENFPRPAFAQEINSLQPGEQKVLNIGYAGYRSWYGRITSKLVLDVDNNVQESNEANNIYRKSFAVNRQ